ncbi:ATP-dependent DNA helicase, RecQ family protein [Brugia malayi]|uniref:ATP-dependent DNA helicase n=1 Tax=Brugia malayi TaxID=6279 RepID=A0A4E9F5N3_BRUMA|nr:ATP-dependent DNA helicase, RecQ family protein [Brugia malayi]VIO89491.1 ATP-dependent DNA helicase, RecQ family protein [Brugia malayi]
MEATGSLGAKLSMELSKLDEELERIEGDICTLRKRKRTLLERKAQIEKRIVERNVENESSFRIWDSDEFQWMKDCRRILHDIFKLSDFRPLQRAVINAVLSREDCLVVMSTGSGKSLCYQLPAVVMKGIVLVISPLVALIEDQLHQLRKLGIDAATLNQSTAKQEVNRIQTALTDSKASLRLLYVTPEKLAKSKRIMNRLEKCNEMKRLKLIAVDEVHCCSQWGHDFRPDFKFLNVLKRQFQAVPLIGLTATATADVIDDVKNMLGIPAAVVFRAGFNRPNLHYSVCQKPSSDAEFVDILVELIKTRFAGLSGIIYCFSRKECEELTKSLRAKGVKASHYHAFLDAGKRNITHEKWLNGGINVIVATVAFGMGIDKPNVRYVIHHSLPKSLENYYQESGRVGRDGNEAHCILFYRLNDLFRQSTMVCTEKTGVRNLYSVLSYCIEASECRRSVIAEHFNVEWNSSLCSKMCDICAQTNAVECIDVTNYWRQMLEAQKTDNNRITGMKLVELTWKKVSSVSRELIELLVAKLILDGYLKEDFHFTPYSIISYVVPDEKSIAMENRSDHRITFSIPSKLICSGKTVKFSRKRPLIIDDDDEDDVVMLSIDMRYTHAIVVRIPSKVKMEKRIRIDLDLAAKQMEELCETLREAGVDIIELSAEERCIQQSLFTGDAAICINGTALITRPRKNGNRLLEISNLLNQLAWQVVETPQASEHNKEIVLEGSDVLYTGKEVFVGIRKNGTNMEGALIVARTFSDLAVIPITLPGNQPLRHYVSLISADVLAVGSSKEAKQVIQRMEREATFRYKTFTVKHDEAVNCLNVNDYVIYREDTPETKFQILHESLQMAGITANELVKIGSPISRFVLLTMKMKTLKSLW